MNCHYCQHELVEDSFGICCLNEECGSIDGIILVKISGNAKYWYLNGKLHRKDGPAVECINGSKHWYQNGQCHREDGPAVEYTNGSKYWYQNGKLHRKYGPATEHMDGHKEYWINGERIK
jgi:antitoxin component YwqK of YwqJK toxin-antitoxin module